MKQYNVTGMSCAACSARVEKAVNAVPGVEGTANEESIIAAVEAAGYGASPKGAEKAALSAEEEYKLRYGLVTRALKALQTPVTEQTVFAAD